MELSPVSRTAILLLICRALESEKGRPGCDDPMAVLCLERLLAGASGEDRRWIEREVRVYSGLQAHHAREGVRRGQAFDRAADRFIADHPHCTVINLACGFDTRFWRIQNERCRYIEIDLPEVMALKVELLQPQLKYETIGGSVTDPAWIERVTATGNTDFLLLAEGLLPWLPQPEAAGLLKQIGDRFVRSQLVLDVIPEKYTRGIWKLLLRLDARISWGLDAAMAFGIRDPQQLEAYGTGLKVIGEEKGSAGPILTFSIH